LSPQLDWPANANISSIWKILGPLAKQYKNLSFADLIVFAAQVALEDTTNLTLPAFCPGRVDALDGEGSTYLQGYDYSGKNLTAGQIFIHKNTARGLNLREAVALQGRLRSKAFQLAHGYRGTWGESTVLSNAFFTTLLQPDTKWTCDNKDECKSSKGEVYMLTEDLALKWEPALFSIAEQYATNNTLFLMEFAWAWNKLVTADRFKGPYDNVCHATFPPRPTPSPTTAATPYGGIIGAGIGGLVLGALVVFIALRSSNRKSGEMYHRAS
jgi:catalase (peroxidase I)